MTYKITFRKNVRSSARMNLFSSAKLKFSMPSDVVGSLMRHSIADTLAAAFGDDGEPAPGVFLEHRLLERIDLVADEDGNGQNNLLFVRVISTRLIDFDASTIIEL